MAGAKSQNRKLLWISLGSIALFALLLKSDMPWGMYVYCTVGLLVAGLWVWNDRSSEKGERWDIAVAVPIMALLWPFLILAMPFMKHFRDDT